MKSEKYTKVEKLQNSFKNSGDKILGFIDDTQNKFLLIKDQVIVYFTSLPKFLLKSIMKTKSLRKLMRKR